MVGDEVDPWEWPAGTRLRVSFVATLTGDGAVRTKAGDQRIGVGWLKMAGAQAEVVGEAETQ